MGTVVSGKSVNCNRWNQCCCERGVGYLNIPYHLGGKNSVAVINPFASGIPKVLLSPITGLF